MRFCDKYLIFKRFVPEKKISIHANSRAESENNATHPQNRNITFAMRKQNNDDLKTKLINTIKGLSKLRSHGITFL